MSYSVRFRHTSGADVGPFPFSSGSSILELKERLLTEWPAGERALGSWRLSEDSEENR